MVEASIHPLSPLVESIVDPGSANHNPEIFPVKVTVILLLALRLNAPLKYCVPDLPVARSGPAGKYPLDKSVLKCFS